MNRQHKIGSKNPLRCNSCEDGDAVDWGRGRKGVGGDGDDGGGGARDVAVLAVVEEKRDGAKVAVVKVAVDQATKERWWGRRGSRKRRWR